MPSARMAETAEVDAELRRLELFGLRRHVNLDAARLRALLQRQHQIEHPVAVGRLNVFRIDVLGKREFPLEPAVADLAEDRLHLFAVFVEAALTPDAQRAANDVDLDLLRRDARNRHRDHPFVAVAVHVRGRSEGTNRIDRLWASRLVKHPTKERVEVAVQTGEFAKRSPTSETQHRNPSFLQSSGMLSAGLGTGTARSSRSDRCDDPRKHQVPRRSSTELRAGFEAGLREVNLGSIVCELV